jgi:hypothetical protein
MSLSDKAAHGISLVRLHQPSSGFAFPLVLVCVALALIIVSAVFFPVTLEAPGAESVLVGP